MYGYQAKFFLYARIMLDAFKDLLCSKLCWYNRPGPNHNINMFIIKQPRDINMFRDGSVSIQSLTIR